MGVFHEHGRTAAGKIISYLGIFAQEGYDVDVTHTFFARALPSFMELFGERWYCRYLSEEADDFDQRVIDFHMTLGESLVREVFLPKALVGALQERIERVAEVMVCARRRSTFWTDISRGTGIILGTRHTWKPEAYHLHGTTDLNWVRGEDWEVDNRASVSCLFR